LSEPKLHVGRYPALARAGECAVGVLVAVILAVTVSCAVAQPPAYAAAARTAFWVSPGGSDSGSGTRTRPFATLDRARNAVRGLGTAWRQSHNITVNLRDGTYRLDHPFVLLPKDSGLGGHDVIYRAQPGAHPVISGAMSVPSEAWTPCSGSILQAQVGQVETRQLYVGGVRAVRARTADYPAGFLPHWTNGGDSGIQYIRTGLNPSWYADPTTWANVSDIEAVIETQWKMMSVPLDSVVSPYVPGGAPGLIGLQQPGWDNANMFRDATSGGPGIWSFWQVTRFENALEFLDEPGEWYLDSHAGTLYYWPRPGESVDAGGVTTMAADVELPVQETLVAAKGKAGRPVSHIRFEGLTFSGATWLQPSGPDGYVADQSGFHLVGSGHEPNIIGHDPNAVRTPGNVMLRFAHHIAFEGNVFEHLGAVGLDLSTGGQGNTIEGNLFTDISSAAVQLGGVSAADAHPSDPRRITRDNLVVGNLVRHVGVEYKDAAGIFAGFTQRTRIVNNTIADTAWAGIAVGWGWGLLDPGGFPGVPDANRGQWGLYRTPTVNRDCVIRDNVITGFLGTSWDGGAVYTTGFQGPSAAHGLLIEGNVASGKTQFPTHIAGGNTFYNDGGSRYITVRGNVSYDNPIGTMWLGPPPQPGDPLPYLWEPSLMNSLPYGSDVGGCRTYGDIRYVGNYWFQDPYWQEIPLCNVAYLLSPLFGFAPYSQQGFYDVCPYTDGQGVSYPTDLIFKDNHIMPGTARAPKDILAGAGVQERPPTIPANRWTLPAQTP